MRTWLDIYDSGISALYVVVGCALLIAALLAARHPQFRRPFYCFAVASTLSVFQATNTLILRLYLVLHHPLLSLELRRGLLLANQIAEIASIVVYCVGFFALVRKISSLPRQSDARVG